MATRRPRKREKPNGSTKYLLSSSSRSSCAWIKNCGDNFLDALIPRALLFLGGAVQLFGFTVLFTVQLPILDSRLSPESFDVGTVGRFHRWFGVYLVVQLVGNYWTAAFRNPGYIVKGVSGMEPDDGSFGDGACTEPVSAAARSATADAAPSSPHAPLEEIEAWVAAQYLARAGDSTRPTKCRKCFALRPPRGHHCKVPATLLSFT